MGTISFRKLTASNSFVLLILCSALLLFGFSDRAEAQTATKLQVLLPGMSAAPGTPSGFTGTPYTQTVGVPFQVIVNATDENWNVAPVSDLVQLTASDPYATLPPVTS